VTKSGKTIRAAVAQTGQTGQQHPGTSPNPYRKRAYDASKAAIGQAIIAAMAVEQRKIIAKAAASFVI
jgi:hypothetical protein